jgi:hypothetical protein
VAGTGCAQVEVPHRLRQPTRAHDNDRVDLAAGDPIKRIGTLFTNPGGPGGSGVDFVQRGALTA